MAAFDPATDYVADWAAHDFVESAEYESPRDIPPERTVGGIKAKFDDEQISVAGQGSPLSYGDSGGNAIAWTPDEPTLRLDIDGVLIAESGSYVIRAATKSRFGVWTLIVERLR